ncbi:MAG: hypothetical protein KF724_12650 [Phycisphaeraceae bacterium]|nr:hypothetical protein [Phycisphaeraceae bacterium]
MAAIPLRRVKSLCTSAEYRLLESSTLAALQGASEAELLRRRKLLRGMRDKWRTQTTSQRRKERSARGGAALVTASRSDTKRQAFAEALERVEQQIARVGAKPTAARTERDAAASKAMKHRRTRAITRHALRETLDDSGGARPGKGAVAPRSKGTSKGVAKGTKASARAGQSASSGSGKSSAGTKASNSQSPRAGRAKGKAARGLNLPATVLLPSNDLGSSTASLAPRLPRLKGRGKVRSPLEGADSAVKARRLKTRGLETRILGHVKAQGKRKQARRDALNAPRG